MLMLIATQMIIVMTMLIKMIAITMVIIITPIITTILITIAMIMATKLRGELGLIVQILEVGIVFKKKTSHKE